MQSSRWAICKAWSGISAVMHCCGLAMAALVIVAGASTYCYAAKIAANNFNMAGDATATRVVMNFDVEPELHWMLLRGPHRLGNRPAGHTLCVRKEGA